MGSRLIRCAAVFVSFGVSRLVAHSVGTLLFCRPFSRTLTLCLTATATRRCTLALDQRRYPHIGSKLCFSSRSRSTSSRVSESVLWSEDRDPAPRQPMPQALSVQVLSIANSEHERGASRYTCFAPCASINTGTVVYGRVRCARTEDNERNLVVHLTYSVQPLDESAGPELSQSYVV